MDEGNTLSFSLRSVDSDGKPVQLSLIYDATTPPDLESLTKPCPQASR